VNRLFYLYGGEYNNGSVLDFQIFWFYDTINKSWNRFLGSDTLSNVSTNGDGKLVALSWPAFGAGAVTDSGVGYYYGGYLSNKSVVDWSGDPFMLNSLVSFNMTTQSWTNRTYDSTPRAEGSMQFIPASESGMLVYFGGLEMSSKGEVEYVNTPTTAISIC
jgi:hypothetical protein